MSAAVMLAATLAHSPLTPATIVVSDLCSLPEAIASANQDVGQGGCVAGQGADVLELTADVVLTAELPSVTDEIFLEGNGFEIHRDSAAPEFRILDLQVVGDVVLRSVTLSGGLTQETGGGLYNNASRVTLDRVRIEGNTALDGGGVHNGPGAVVFTAKDSTVSDNLATYGTPGLVTAKVTFLSSTTVSGNRGEGHYSDGGGITVETFNRLTLLNSTVSDNYSDSGGGGVLIAGGYGAASTLINSTIVGNESLTGVGGIQNYYNWLKPFTRLFNTIVASNGQANCSTRITNWGGGLDDDGTCDEADPIVVGVDIDPELSDNGGPTLTHRLLPGSVAVDAGSACGTEKDQRGVPRGRACDSGAVELEGSEASGDGGEPR